jgi:hypothetical protein
MFFRPQNYSILAVIAAFATYLFLPLANFSVQTTLPCQISALGLEGLGGFSQYNWMFWIFSGLIALVVLLLVVAIVVFKKRKLQLKLVFFAFFANLLVLGGSFLLIEFITDKLSPDGSILVSYQLAVYTPIITLLLLMFAQRKIKQDERKVRAYDRIR